ncbi:hypothetical protein QUF49_18915 [Fictibacillus sp. b24]|uniref:hypothetical protein n=1 Tax=Fictibacillus sp. b24 TaxID=3055863 RepID=UPI0025A1DE63|nr:hypothetical protein [Fictibacillus sp. b24]MDM5318074.1 hypothetical protein [Fictibacillus sp. b24]
MSTNTFKIDIHGVTIDNNTMKQEFINKFASYLLSTNINSKMFVFKDPVLINELNLWIVVHFKNNSVSIIELENADESLKNNYGNWSNYNVEKKKESHDLWLKKNFGEPSDRKGNSIIYYFPFCQIISYIDEKSGEVGIAIEYK